MKRVIECLWVLAIVSVVLLAGCNQTPEERIEKVELWVTKAEQLSEELDTAEEQLAVELSNMNELLEDPALSEELRTEVKDAIAEGQERIAYLKTEKQKVDTALAKFRAKLDALRSGEEVSFGDELSLYGQMIMSGSKAAPSEYSGFIYLAGLVITTVGGLFAGKKHQEKKDEEYQNMAEDEFDGLVHSVSKAMEDMEPYRKEETKKKLKTAQERMPGLRSRVQLSLEKEKS